MILTNWLVVNKNGVKSVRKQKPSLDWDEVAVKLNIDVPKELFERPTLEASLVVSEIPNNAYHPDVILDTVDLIEQQTGAKINFTVSTVVENESNES